LLLSQLFLQLLLFGDVAVGGAAGVVGLVAEVFEWDADAGKFVANALSPAQAISVTVDEADRRAVVTVPDTQLSLAIGKEGQNARLAAKLSGWRVDIKKESDSPVPQPAEAEPEPEPEPQPELVAVEAEPETMTMEELLEQTPVEAKDEA